MTTIFEILAAKARGDTRECEWVPTKDPEPTDAPPGSARKIAVLAARVEAGEHLWHKDDARIISRLARHVEFERPSAARSGRVGHTFLRKEF